MERWAAPVAISDNATFAPSQERHGGIVSLSQQLNPAISVDVKAFYGRRETYAPGFATGTANIASTNPFYAPVPGVSSPHRVVRVYS